MFRVVFLACELEVRVVSTLLADSWFFESLALVNIACIRYFVGLFLFSANGFSGERGLLGGFFSSGGFFGGFRSSFFWFLGKTGRKKGGRKEDECEFFHNFCLGMICVG